MYTIETDKGNVVLPSLLLKGLEGIQLAEKIREHLKEISKSSLLYSEDPIAKEFIQLQMELSTTTEQLDKATSSESKARLSNKQDEIQKSINTCFYKNTAKIIELTSNNSVYNENSVFVFIEILKHFKVDSNLIDSDLYAIGDYDLLIATIANEKRNSLYSFLANSPLLNLVVQSSTEINN